MSSKKYAPMLAKSERRFASNLYDGDCDNCAEESFVHLKGSIPVLISAPHSVNQKRNGEIKYCDKYTGGLACILHKLTDCYTVYKKFNDGTDANYDMVDKDNGYKKNIVNTVKENKIKYVIDLHGASDQREFDIDIGTDNGRTIRGKTYLVHIIRQICKANGIEKVFQDNTFAASLPTTITNYVSEHTNAICIQLEIHKKYRTTGNKDLLYSLVNALSTLVKMLSFLSDINHMPILYEKINTAEIINPLDRVVVPLEIALSLGLSDHDIVHISSGIVAYAEGKFVLAKVSISSDSRSTSIQVSNHIYRCITEENVFPEESCIFIVPRPISCKAGILPLKYAGSNSVFICNALYPNISPYRTYALYNKKEGILYPVTTFSEYESKYKKTIFLSQYYRQILSVCLPPQFITEKMRNSIIDSVGLDVTSVLSEAYSFDSKDKYILNESGYLANQEEVVGIFKRCGYNDLDIVDIGPKAKRKKNWLRFSENFFVGKKSLHLKVFDPFVEDENEKIARLSGNIMKVLGVEEMDKVDVIYEGERITFRALPYEDNNSNDKIGISMHNRLRLGILSPNAIVSVNRNIPHIIKKNFSKQILPLLALTYTIFQLGLDIIFRCLLYIISVAIVYYLSLSGERAKVK